MKTVLLILFLTVTSIANANELLSDTTRRQHIIRLHNGTEIVENVTETTIEEPVESKKKKKKAKVRKPKSMKYRLALLEVEFEVEKYRKKLAACQGEERRSFLQELIDKVSLLNDVKKVDYNQDYTQILVLFPDESEYRVNL